MVSRTSYDQTPVAMSSIKKSTSLHTQSGSSAQQLQPRDGYLYSSWYSLGSSIRARTSATVSILRGTELNALEIGIVRRVAAALRRVLAVSLIQCIKNLSQCVPVILEFHKAPIVVRPKAVTDFSSDKKK